MGHTKGEWKLDELNGFIGCNDRTIGSANIEIDEGLSNARLIAAAPELLKLCKQSLDFLSRMGHNIQLLDTLQQTIAKAEKE